MIVSQSAEAARRGSDCIAGVGHGSDDSRGYTGGLVIIGASAEMTWRKPPRVGDEIQVEPAIVAMPPSRAKPDEASWLSKARDEIKRTRSSSS